MEWEASAAHARWTARGKLDRYVIVRAVGAGYAITGIRLTRWPIEHEEHDPFQQGEAAARNMIEFPLGRGPGRPAGSPEIDALIEMAKEYADQYEHGQGVNGYPHWQRRSWENDPREAARLAETVERLAPRGGAPSHQCDADGRCDACKIYGFCSKCGCPDAHPALSPEAERLVREGTKNFSLRPSDTVRLGGKPPYPGFPERYPSGADSLLDDVPGSRDYDITYRPGGADGCRNC